MSKSGTIATGSKKDKTKRPPDPDKDLALIVSGDGVITRLASIYFGAAGFETTVAENGLEAIRSWKIAEPDVVILDIGAPQMTGLEFCKWIRMEKRDLTTPVVAITVFTNSENRDKIIKAGANAFLTKPVDMSQLLDVVKQELG